MKEEVRKEVLKLLEVGLIYPIFDSAWSKPSLGGTEERGHDSHSTCMHRILLEDGAKTVRQPQR